MKTSKVYLFFAIFVLSVPIKGFSQQCVCAGDLRIFNTQFTSGLPVIGITSITGGREFDGRPHEYVIIQWDTSPTGSVTITDSDGSTTYTTSLNVLKRNVTLTQPTFAGSNVFVADAQNQISTTIGGQCYSTSNIQWEVQDVNGNWHTLNETGTTISFIPNNYASLLSSSYNSTNLHIRAFYRYCSTTRYSTARPFTITLLPVEIRNNSDMIATIPTCNNSNDGSLTINQIYVDNEPISSGQLIGENLKFSYASSDNLGTDLGSITTNSLNVTFDNIPPSEVPYVLIIERMIGSLSSGVTNDFNFTISNGPTIALKLDKTSPDCHTSSLIVNAKVNDTGLSGYSFKGATGSVSGNSFNYNLASPATYNLYAENTTVPACTTATVQFINPSQKTLTLTPKSPTCNGGSDGELTLTATTNYSSQNYTGTFRIYNNGDATSPTDSWSITGETLPYILEHQFNSGDYYVAFYDGTCESKRELVNIQTTTNASIIVNTPTFGNITNCLYPNGYFNVSAAGGNTSLSYQLFYSNNNPATLSQNNGFFNVTVGDSYYVIVSDECNTTENSETKEISVIKPSIVNSDTTKLDASCNGGSAKLTLNNFSYNGQTAIDAGLSNFTLKFERDGFFEYKSVDALPFDYNVYGGQDWDITISHNIFGCSLLVDFPEIWHPNQILLSTDNDKESCRDIANGSITASSTYGSTVFGATRTFILTNNIGNVLETITDDTAPYQADFSNDYPAESYWVTVSDGCTVNGSTEVAVSITNYPALEVDIDTFDISCNNTNDGKIRVTPIAGDENFTLSFTGITTFTGRITNHTDSIISLESGDYEVLVTDGNGCTNTYNGITISNPPPLQITSEDSNITPVTCWDGNDGAIVVNATGGTDDIYFGVYDDGDNLLDSTSYAPDYSNVFDTLKAGTKTIKVTDINKCFVEKDFIILQPDEYKITNLSTDSTKCYGGSDGSLSVTATGGTPNGLDYTYNLMDVNNDIVDNVIGTTANFTGHPFGNYYVNIYDSSSCLLTSATIELSQPEEMKITKNMSAVSCYSTTDITLSANILGGTAPYSYIWKDENEYFYSSDSSIKVNEGNYFLNVVDANNCGYGRTIPRLEPFSLHYAVEKPDTLKLFIDNLQNVDYHGLSNGSVTLSSIGGWSFHQYSINGTNYQDLPEFGNLSIGPYTFYVKDGSNCEDSFTATITQPEPFIVYLDSIINVKCFDGSDGQIIIHAEGGWAPYNFTLDDGNGYTITQNDSVFLNLPIGTYSVTVGYNTYSQLVNNIAIGQPSSALSSDITTYQSPKCNFSDGWATVTASGGTSPYSYSWSNAQTSATATALHSGNYYVVTSDFNNCLDTSSIMLYDIAGPELSIIQINGLPCYDSDNVGSITLDVSGGTGPYTIQWNDSNQQTGLTATGLATGTYSATVTDFDGCISKSKDTLITRPSELIISFDAFKDPSCNNDSDGEITASGSGGSPPYQFEWPGINNAGNTGIVSGLSSGVYQLNLSDNHACVTTGSFELKNPDPIIINLNDSVFICAGQTATLDAGNPGSYYQWTSENGFNSDKQIVNLQEQGDYTITVSNVQGCSNTKKVHLKFENRQFDAGFLLASQATMTDTIVLIEISWPVPDSLEWFIADDFLRLVDGDAYKELIPLETGEYTFGMKAYLAGCEDIVEKTITIIPADGQKDLKNELTDLIQSAKLFPNPNSGNFEVEIKLAYEADVRADLFSIKGLRIIPTKYDCGKKDYLIDFNLMRLEPGVYFVNVAAGNEVRKLKFVVN